MVETIPDGQAARSLYQKFGFVPSNESIPNGPEGGSRQKFILSIPVKDYANETIAKFRKGADRLGNCSL